MFIIILILSFIFAFLAAYTTAVQGTTLALGRLLDRKTENERGSGIQDAITPKTQSIRNLIMLALSILIFGVTTYSYAWYHGIWVMVACCIISVIIKIYIVPRSGSPILVSAIISDMQRRQEAYLADGDNLRAQLIEYLLGRLKNLPQEEIDREVKQSFGRWK